MAGETYRKKDTVELLTNKFVIVIGDSVQRSVYKDLVVFLQDDRYLSNKELKDKGEPSFMDDALYEGGRLHNGTHYREVRQFKHPNGQHIIRYYFVTKVYNDYWETIFEDLESGPKPDVILMNSCLWDMNRYGPSWLNRYQDNLDRMMTRMRQVVPEHCLVIWNTCMPVGRKARGGFMVRREPSWRQQTIRYDVLEANYNAKQAVQNHGFDCLDLNWYFRQVQGYQGYRQRDDVHWDRHAHRMITNLILGHIADAWGVPKPRFMRPLDDNLQPHAHRKHVRSHTIDARHVEMDQNRFVDRPLDIASCRGVTDLNNNIDFSKDVNVDIGVKRRRLEPRLMSEGLHHSEGNPSRRRRVEIVYDRRDGAHGDLKKESAQLMPRSSNTGNSLQPPCPAVPKQMGSNNSQQLPCPALPRQMGSNNSQQFPCPAVPRQMGSNNSQQLPCPAVPRPRQMGQPYINPQPPGTCSGTRLSGFAASHPANVQVVNQIMTVPLAKQIIASGPPFFNCVPFNSPTNPQFFVRGPNTPNVQVNGCWPNQQYIRYM